MNAFYQEGRYNAEVINQALGKNQKGTPQFVLKVKILCRIEDGEVVKISQQYERSIYMYLSEKAAEYTIDKLKGIGFEGPSIRQLDLGHAQAHDFRTKVIELDCRHEENNQGDIVERWDLTWVSDGGIDITPLEPAEARKLDSLFGKSLGGTKAPKTNGKPAPVQTAVAEDISPITDDDIPFGFVFWFALASALLSLSAGMVYFS